MFTLSEEKIDHIFTELGNNYPVFAINATNRWGALKQYMTSDFTSLVTIMISSLTRAKLVAPVCERLFAVANTPQSMLNFSEPELAQLLFGVGDATRKARNLLSTCRDLVEKHNGAVPNDKAALLNLKGVGNVTASLVLTLVFNEPDLPLDRDSHRVLTRVGLVNTANKRIATVEANMRVPQKYKVVGHEWLAQHGREVCTTYAPFCEGCFLADTCRAYVTGQSIM